MRTFLAASLIFLYASILLADETEIYNFAFDSSQTSASSVLRERGKPADLYDPKNANDGNSITAWCSSSENGGIGEWIEFRAARQKPFTMRGVALSNGYTATEEQYFANNRVKEIKITVLTITGREETFQKQMRDTFPSKNRLHPNLGVAHHLLNFPPCKKKCSSGEKDSYGSRENIAKIRITVVSVYPGKKHNDTCISEVRWLQ